MKFILSLCFLLWLQPVLFSQEIIAPPSPDLLVNPVIPVNTQQVSDIDIPVRINLKPMYSWANSYVDTLYTSPNYPNTWVENGCNIRFQYRFVRGPFSFKTLNNVLYISFSGFYGLRGSTRLCTDLGNSPWTPACSCGLGTEAPRRIDATFSVQFQLKPDYTLGVTVNRVNPVPVDKCSMCFFGKDITQIVADQLKNELDASIKSMQTQMQTFTLKPYIQTVWDNLQTPTPLPGFGFLNTQPMQLRISQAILARDSLFFSLGLSARPELKAAPEVSRKPLQALTDFKQRSGFKIFVAQQLPYDSLSGLVNTQVAGKEFTMGKGLFKKTVRMDSVKLMGIPGKVLVKVFVSKSARGVFYLEGVPVWNATKQELWFDSLDYQVQTKQLLVRTVSVLLEGTITTKLKELTRFNLAPVIKDLNAKLLAQINRSVYKGVNSKGYLSNLKVESIVASDKGIFVAAGTEGKLWIDVNAGILLAK